MTKQKTPAKPDAQNATATGDTTQDTTTKTTVDTAGTTGDTGTGTDAGTAGTDTAGAGPDAGDTAQGKPGTDDEVQETIVVAAATFPRSVKIVNELPIARVIGNAFVPAHGNESVTVKDADELTRLKSDCEQLNELNGSKAQDGKMPLRIED